MREQFLNLLRSVNRSGTERLIEFLNDETDFFSAPASTSYHGSHPGGLLEHSLAVYENLDAINRLFNLNHDLDTIITVALLHDICKANFYRIGVRNRKNEETGQWEKVNIYEIHDQLPLGHGEKSVMIIQRYISLIEEEMIAVRWHMGAFDDSARGYSGAQCLSSAMQKHSLLVALQIADLAASYLDKK